MKKISKFMKIFLISLCTIAILAVVYIFIGENILTVEEYQFKSDKITNPVRIVAISDLHDREFGDDNKDLVNKIKEQDPDIITILGDMNLESNSNDTVVISLLRRLVNIAPVYYCLGNHEMAVFDSTSIVSDIESTGAILLDDEIVKTTICGNDFSIGGISLFYFWDGKAGATGSVLSRDSTDKNFKLLLCHYPEYYMWWLKKENIDLILSGHAHGGLVRLPFVGGLYAPEQRWFPKYSKGYYDDENLSTMLVTTGLWRSSWLPRVNNPPEIMVVNITRE